MSPYNSHCVKYKSNALYFVADLNTYVSGMHIEVFIFLDVFKCRNYFLQVLLTNPRTSRYSSNVDKADRPALVPGGTRGQVLISTSDVSKLL